MRLIDWREADGAALTDIWRDQVARWNDRLAWNSGPNWDDVEVARRTGRLPGLILLDDSRIYGWTFFLVHHDTLQIGGFETSSSASTRTLLDAVLSADMLATAPAGVMLFAFSDAPGLVPALEARGFETAAYRYMVRPVDGIKPVTRRFEWTADVAADLPGLMARAYQQPQLTRPFSRGGTAAEWREYAAQIMGSACGKFSARLSAAHRLPGGELAAAVVTTVVSPGTAHIAQVVVAPEAQGQGEAAALLQEVLASVREAGFEGVSLLVSERNAAAIRLYTRAGFSETARFTSAGRAADKSRVILEISHEDTKVT